jgi:hypothetical protein
MYGARHKVCIAMYDAQVVPNWLIKLHVCWVCQSARTKQKNKTVSEPKPKPKTQTKTKKYTTGQSHISRNPFTRFHSRISRVSRAFHAFYLGFHAFFTRLSETARSSTDLVFLCFSPKKTSKYVMLWKCVQKCCCLIVKYCVCPAHVPNKTS